MLCDYFYWAEAGRVAVSKRLRADHEVYEFRGGHVRVSRTTRDCDMAEHKDGWQNAIQPGCTYVWLSHGLNVCNLHFSMEDVVNGRDGVGDSAEAAESDRGAGDV